MSEPCAFPDCGRRRNSGELCYNHRKMQIAGKPLRAMRRYSKLAPDCLVPQCVLPVFARDLCKKHVRIRTSFNLSAERIIELFTDPKCWICGNVQTGPRRLHIDHRHGHHDDPQKGCNECVRGLLCAPCNQGLGMLREDPAILRAAIRYLEAAA